MGSTTTTPEADATTALLTEFLGFLDHSTDTFDPLMIAAARARGERHLAPDHVAELVHLFLFGEPPQDEDRGTGPNAYPSVIRDATGRAVDVG